MMISWVAVSRTKSPSSPPFSCLHPKRQVYKTLDGRNVAPVKPGNPRDCRNFIEDYAAVDGTAVYGFERYLYQYLSEAYDDEIEYDIDKIKLWSLDIETASENGFPKPDLAEEEVLLITLKNYKTKRLITFGSREYTPTRDDVEYIHCPREYDLLTNFVAWWESVEPEVVTGWNVETVRHDISLQPHSEGAG